MSALQKIRSKSTLLVGVIAVGLLAFVVPWGEITQFLNVSKDKAFVVNGDVIKTGQYSQRIEQRENLERMRTRDGQLDEQQMARIRDEVFQTMVNEKLLEDQAEKLGLYVTDAELNDMVHGAFVSPVLYEIPYFVDPQTGQFSRAALNEFLTEVKKPDSQDPAMRAQQEELRRLWSYVENRMRTTRLEEKYASLVSGSVLVNNVEAKAYYNDSKDVATIAYLSKDYSDIDDSTIEVSDQEIQDLYNIRKENFFSQYPSRTISYFVKNVVPSEADYQEAESQMKMVKEELATTDNPGMIVNQYSSTQYIDAHIAVNSWSTEIKNFVQSASVGDIHGPTRGDRMYSMYKYVAKTVAPDSIKIQMLPVQSFDPTQATAIADSLQNVLKGGKSFASLAQEMYPNTPSVGEGQWADEMSLSSYGIADQCFAAAKGSVIKVDLGGMTSLIKIEDKTNPVTKVKVAVVNMPVIVSDKTNNSIDNEINKFLSENKVSADFEQAAINAGYNLIENVIVMPSNYGIGNTPSTRDVVRWAFNDNKGEIKKFETKDARIVAVVKGESKAGYWTADNSEVKKALSAEIRKDRKAEKLITELKAKSATSLDALAQSLDAKVDSAKFVTFQTNNISGLGYEPTMNVYAKAGKANSLTQPVKGQNGVYVLNVASRAQEDAEYNEEVIKGMLQGNYAQMLFYSASDILTIKMDVEDNRVTFY